MLEPIIPEYADEVGSTSDILRRRAADGAPEAALLAGRQTAGRGRLGRVWVSPPGNLHLSVLLRPAPPFRPGHWSLLAAVAMASAVRSYTPDVRLKWPNDVFLRDGKLAGLLLDADPAAGWVVIGFGANLVQAPPGLGRAVAALADMVAPPPPLAFARAVLDRLSQWRAVYERDGFEPVRAAWLAFGPAPGDVVGVGGPDGRLDGRFAGIGPEGGLLLEIDGQVRTVLSGEVA